MGSEKHTKNQKNPCPQGNLETGLNQTCFKLIKGFTGFKMITGFTGFKLIKGFTGFKIITGFRGFEFITGPNSAKDVE